MESESGFNMGRAAELTRDELKFTKFVQRLRKRFTQVFNDILKTQLVLKGIITIEDWVKIKEHIQYTFLKDGYFAELKNAEILRERIGLCQEVSPYVGKYYSVEYVRKYILQQTDEDIIEIESISRKLFILNEKRKLIENNIFDEALIQAKQQVTNKFIVVHGFGWHKGVLGIIASRLINQFYKPTIVISFDQTEGVGSARSINMIDLGSIILTAKKKGLLINGGGHKMAAG